MNCFLSFSPESKCIINKCIFLGGCLDNLVGLGSATQILNAYTQQFPLDNFDKIRDLIIDNFEINEMEQISNALDRINLKEDYKQKHILECLTKTYHLQVTPEHPVDEGIAAE